MSFGLKSFGQMSFGRISFGQKSFGQTLFGRMPIWPKVIWPKVTFGQKSFGQTLFGRMPFGQKLFGQKSFGRVSIRLIPSPKWAPILSTDGNIIEWANWQKHYRLGQMMFQSADVAFTVSGKRHSTNCHSIKWPMATFSVTTLEEKRSSSLSWCRYYKTFLSVIYQFS